MNKLRKIGVLLLALSLVLGMTAPAMAATGSITVENPIQGQNYTAYKIFDVTYSENGSAYAYTIPQDSKWYDAVAAYAGITLTKVTDESNGIRYVVAEGTAFSAADFANHLKSSLTSEMEGVVLTSDGSKATATGLPLGYYFVTSTNGALCNLTTTDPSASIYDKNDIPFDKVDDAQDVEVGQTVTYTITGKVPSTTGFSAYTYEFSDTMSDGLSFGNDVKVYVGGAELGDEFYTYTHNEAANGFTLSIDVTKLQDEVAQEIKVVYSAVVNENAIASVEKNSATLKYSNDPTSTSTTTTEPDEETVYSSRLVIDKFAMSGETKLPLAGATFVLKNEAGLFYQYSMPETDDPETAEDETAGKVNWVESQNNATQIVTDENGAASFGGLADGTYYLIETEAPAGYNLLTEPHEVVINGSDDTEAELTVTAEVQNMFGTELPETGGAGTTLFYLVGGALVAGAFIVLVTRKRMHTEK